MKAEAMVAIDQDHKEDATPHDQVAYALRILHKMGRPLVSSAHRTYVETLSPTPVPTLEYNLPPLQSKVLPTPLPPLSLPPLSDPSHSDSSVKSHIEGILKKRHVLREHNGVRPSWMKLSPLAPLLRPTLSTPTNNPQSLLTREKDSSINHYVEAAAPSAPGSPKQDEGVTSLASQFAMSLVTEKRDKDKGVNSQVNKLAKEYVERYCSQYHADWCAKDVYGSHPWNAEMTRRKQVAAQLFKHDILNHLPVPQVMTPAQLQEQARKEQLRDKAIKIQKDEESLRKQFFSSQAVDTTPKQVDKMSTGKLTGKSTAGIPPWISAQQQHELGTLASDSPMARAATLVMGTPAPVACSIASRTVCGHVVHGSM
jgi:hypothetical protein